MQRIDVPVLIVGAGPAGLTAAIALARQGVASLAGGAAAASRSSLPRATAISTRTMELFRVVGAGGGGPRRRGRGRVAHAGCPRRSRTPPSGIARSSSAYPTRAQAALISPTAPACVPQDHLERVLLGTCARSGRAGRLGTEVVGVENGPDGVRVDAAGRGTGASAS